MSRLKLLTADKISSGTKAVSVYVPQEDSSDEGENNETNVQSKSKIDSVPHIPCQMTKNHKKNLVFSDAS